jgi:7,8-dihydropterin-6-yl-methyl-4-(beta-D-ribofuranosyl)aminobenzene 5'-phosphate synthase
MPRNSPFDEHHNRYESWFATHNAAYCSELLAVRSLLPRDGFGLEIGVGTGRFAAPLGISVGLDPSAAMLEHASARGIRVVRGVAEQLPFATGSFDYALSAFLRAGTTTNPMVRAWLVFLIVGILVCLGCGVASGGPASRRMPTITVVYDNNTHVNGLEAAWGFSCLVEGIEKTVLFDTGGDGGRLLANMRKLGIDPQKLDVVVISHIHGDHAGGLHHLLRENREVVTYLPRSFPESFKRDVEQHGSRVVPVHDPVTICEGVFSTGEVGTMLREQALVVRTGRGLVVITGCAHPGIEKIVHTAKERFGGEIFLVLGGFHLAGSTMAEIEPVIAGLKKLGVLHVAPCHCTGAAARRLLKQSYASGFIDVGVGKVIVTEGLRRMN